MEELKSKSIFMDTLKASIINAIKTLRSHKKMPIWTHRRKINRNWENKNKLSNNRNSYYLTDDSTDITDFQPPILTITNTPIVEKNVNLDNNLNSVSDQIESFISSDTGPDATGAACNWILRYLRSFGQYIQKC